MEGDQMMTPSSSSCHQHLHDYFSRCSEGKVCAIYCGSGFPEETEASSYGDTDYVAERLSSMLTGLLPEGGFVGVVNTLRHVLPAVHLGILRAGSGFFNLNAVTWQRDLAKARSVLGLKFLVVDEPCFGELLKDHLSCTGRKRMGWLRTICVRTWRADRASGRPVDDDYHDDDQNQEKEEPSDAPSEGEECSWRKKQLRSLWVLELDPEVAHQPFTVDDPKHFKRSFEYAYAMQTSGTTGKPKYVLVPHSSIVPNVRDFINSVWKMEPSDVVWGCSNTTFDPSVVDMFCTLGIGGTILYLDERLKMEGGNLLGNLLRENRVSVVQMTPSLFRKVGPGLLQAGVLDPTCSSLKVLAFGGEKCLSKEELKKFISEDMYSSLRALVNLYGLTEMSCWASYGLIELTNDNPICIGQNLSETEVICYKSEYTLYTKVFIKSDTRICIVLDENGVALALPEKLPEKLSGSKFAFATGDVGMNHAHGGLEIVGRSDNMVKRSGVKISLSLIEQAAMDNKYVSSAVAIYSDYDDKIYLIIVPVSVLSSSDQSVVSMEQDVEVQFFPFFQLFIPPQCYPNMIIAVGSIPVNENGKLDIQRILRLATATQLKSVGLYHIEKSVVRQVLHQLWLKATDRRRSSIELQDILQENFYAAGGTSVMSVWLMESLLMCFSLYGTPEGQAFQKPFREKLALASFKDVGKLLLSLLEKNPPKTLLSVVDSKHSASLHQIAVDGHWTAERRQLKRPLWQVLINDVNLVPDESLPSRTLPKLDDLSITSIPPKFLAHFEFNMFACVDAAPAISSGGQTPGVVVAQAHSGVIIAVSTAHLKSFHKKKKGSHYDSAPVLWARRLLDRLEAEAVICSDSRFVYIGCHNKRLYKLALPSGIINSIFTAKGIIRTKVALTVNNAKLVLIDNCDFIYCLSTENLELLWQTKVHNRLRPTFPPLIDEDLVVVTTMFGGVAAYSLEHGGRVWPVDSKHRNEAWGPPAIWNSSLGKLVVCTVRNGFSARHLTTGEEVLNFRDPCTETSPIAPIVHHCNQRPNFSEVILQTASGLSLILRVGEASGQPEIQALKTYICPTTTPPIVICVNSNNLTPNNNCGSRINTCCKLLVKPTGDEVFKFYDILPIEENSRSLSIFPDEYNSQVEDFSRPLFQNGIFAFGSRDDKLHVIFYD